jgi:hypothetical protein
MITLLRLLTLLGALSGILVGVMRVQWSVQYHAAGSSYELLVPPSPCWAPPRPSFSDLAAANAARGTNAEVSSRDNAPFRVDVHYNPPPAPGGTFVVDALVGPTVVRATVISWVLFCVVALLGRSRAFNVRDPLVTVVSSAAVGGLCGLMVFALLLWLTGFWIGIPYIFVLGIVVGGLGGFRRVHATQQLGRASGRDSATRPGFALLRDPTPYRAAQRSRLGPTRVRPLSRGTGATRPPDQRPDPGSPYCDPTRDPTPYRAAQRSRLGPTRVRPLRIAHSAQRPDPSSHR